MLKTKLEDQFINKLVEETYEFVPEEEISRYPTDLYTYFQSHEECSEFLNPSDRLLFSYFTAHEMSFSSLSLEDGVYCAKIGGTLYGFPNNWGIFKDIENMANNDYLYICKMDDHEVLGEVFSDTLGYPTEVVIISHESRKYISFIREGNMGDLTWICRFLGLEEQLKEVA